MTTLLLREAHRGDNKLTVTQGVMATGKTFKKVEACLRAMVRARYIDVDNAPESGAMVYIFPELVGRGQSTAQLDTGPTGGGEMKPTVETDNHGP